MCTQAGLFCLPRRPHKVSYVYTLDSEKGNGGPVGEKIIRENYDVLEKLKFSPGSERPSHESQQVLISIVYNPQVARMGKGR